ncbi:MAG TPA: Gfo/Idh/MocA family oxidoreductase [Planctomycetes bacterium]|nr:Gfo/Idh/MocA family oxidoreductase [Planctomycetota bacterium]
MAERLGIGLVGQGFMGRAHSNAWGQAARFFDLSLRPSLVQVVARNRETLPRFAERFGWQGWGGSLRSLVQNPEVDLVDIGTPNQLHASQALAALAAGKHVACEKPLARNLEEARVLRRAARKAAKRGVRSYVWFNYRRCPAIGLAYQLMREGRLGRIQEVRACYLQSWGGPETPMSWRFDRSKAGSGAHGDLNAHLVDLVRFLTGEELVRVEGAAARSFVRERSLPGARGKAKTKARSNVDELFAFFAGLSGGGLCSFEASRVASGRLNHNCLELYGTKGAFRFDLEKMNVLEFFDARLPRREQGFRRILATEAEHPWVASWWPEGHLLGYEHSFVNMAADICRELAGEEPEVPLPSFEDGYRVQAVLDAALRSARGEGKVRVRL